MNTWHPLEFAVHRSLKSLPLRGESLCLGLSGGADSTAALLILRGLEHALGFRLQVLHCHHGTQQNGEFRDRSEAWTRELCHCLQVPWRVVRNEDATLSSEAQLREFRHQSMQSVVQGGWQVWAHHRDDLLETRLMRLIRGTGPQGLEAMSLAEDRVLRPLLFVTRAEIENYLREKKQDFLVDPSQDDFRSFIRKEWLPLLETRQPGAIKSLASSLENISANARNMDFSLILKMDDGDIVISQSEFHCLDLEQKTQVFAQAMRKLGLRDYTRGHIKEVLKHLDRDQIVHSFKVAGLRWDIDAKNIRASKTR